MRILLLTFYYPPDLSAGSFRSAALIEALQESAPPGSRIDVVTTLPNRYHSYPADAPLREERGAVTITRIPLPKHRSGKVDQALSALTFFRGAAREAARHEYDVVVATSGRLMTAVVGAFIARRRKTPLYLDIRDIFVHNSKEILPRPVSWVLTPAFSLLEGWTVRRACHVNLVSRGFEPHFTSRYPKQRFTYLTNGVDDEFLEAVRRAPEPKDHGSKVTVMYAGNLGESQGLEFIVPELAARLGPRVQFRMVGDGGRRAVLEAAVRAKGVRNVEILPPVPRAALIEAYRGADVLFLHLNDYEAFKTVLPSKLFEYAALGKPIWAGVAGYTAEFVRSEIPNAAVFPPCAVEDALRAFDALRMESTPREEFNRKYARKTITRVMAGDIVAAAGSRAK